jgi:hypothetical protein
LWSFFMAPESRGASQLLSPSTRNMLRRSAVPTDTTLRRSSSTQPYPKRLKDIPAGPTWWCFVLWRNYLSHVSRRSASMPPRQRSDGELTRRSRCAENPRCRCVLNVCSRRMNRTHLACAKTTRFPHAGTLVSGEARCSLRWTGASHNKCSLLSMSDVSSTCCAQFRTASSSSR